MRLRPVLARATLAATLVLFAGSSASALNGVPFSRDVEAQLSVSVRPGELVVVPRLALDTGVSVSLTLEEFQVFAPGAKIVEFSGHGPVLHTPPQDRYFRGAVVGDPDSLVFLVSGRQLRGFVQTQGALYTVAPEANVYGAGPPETVSRIRRVDLEHDRAPAARVFRCDNDLLGARTAAATGGMVASALSTIPSSCGGTPTWSGTVYAINLAIETDYEFYQLFPSIDAEIRYIGDLTAAASAIYQRDVATVFQIGTVHLYSSTSPPYPWASSYSSTLALLYAVGDYWHANYPKASYPRTAVHMLSGKRLGGGIAWIGVLCAGDFQVGSDWGGAYGVSSNLAGQFSLTNPSYYWDLQCYTHEMGHNFGTPHTHCYSPPVDHCYNTETATGLTCYSGSLCQNGTSDPCNIGTIMSYCHLRSGGESNINLYFGETSLPVPNGCQPSQAVQDCMRAFVESNASCLNLEAAAPTVTGIAPPNGPTTGGTSVAITGTGFQPMATVTIGGVNATGITVNSSTSITATTGAHTAGTVNVVVQNPDSQSGTLANGFTYGACSAPSTPSLTAPVSVVSGFAYTVSWSATSSDGTYELQESTDPGFSGASSAPITGTSQGFNHTVASATTYYYRVRAKIMCGVSAYFSSWSSSAATLIEPPPAASAFYTLTPCRVFDTRTANGPLGGPILSNGVVRNFTVVGTCGIPADAEAISVNVTVTGATALGSLLVYPGNVTTPLATSISFTTGRSYADMVTIRLAPDGSGTIAVVPTGADVQFILDVNGFFR